MPTLPVARDATTSPPDSLVPRELDPASLIARQPAIDFTSGSAVARDALIGSPVVKRQQAQQTQQGIIPTYYNLEGPSSGLVVGIVLGSVAGFLLICWLLFSLTLIGGVGAGGTTIAGEEEIVVRRRRNSQSARSRRSARTEVREYSRSPRTSGGRSQVIVEERRGPPRPRSVVVEERIRVPGDDVVEVIEEHDDYRSSRRGSRRGGYR